MKRVYRIFFVTQCIYDPYFVLFDACDLSCFDVVLCPSSRKILATPLLYIKSPRAHGSRLLAHV